MKHTARFAAIILVTVMTACGTAKPQASSEPATDPAFIGTILEGVDIQRTKKTTDQESSGKTYTIKHAGLEFDVPVYMQDVSRDQTNLILQSVYPNDDSGIVVIPVSMEKGWGNSTESLLDYYLKSANIKDVISKNKVVLEPPFDSLETYKYSGRFTDDGYTVGYMIRNTRSRALLGIMYIEAKNNGLSHEADFERMVATMRPGKVEQEQSK